MNLITRFLDRQNFARQFLFMVTFGAIFMLTAYYWRDFYYRFLDNTEYLTIDSPISVGNTFYKPGDLVSVSAGVEAKIDVQAVVLTELVLVQAETGDYARVDGSQIIQNAPFRRQDHHIVTTYLKLPNPLEDGTYYWKGNACYKVRGYDKCESYVSETFNVTQTGLSPAGDDLQQQIDDLK